ncbi:MAG: ABC transporter permease [Pseudomonadota bacterium]|nr:ABC transporter permease [Pseudomonadota bacterium]
MSRSEDTALWARLRSQRLAGLTVLLTVGSFLLPLGTTGQGVALNWNQVATPFVFACCGLFTALLAVVRPPSRPAGVLAFALAAGIAALAPLSLLETDILQRFGTVAWAGGFWCYTAALGLLAITTVRRLARLSPQRTAGAWGARYGPPLLFGIWVLVFWQLLTRAFDVPQVLLPAPSVVGHALGAGAAVLWGDFEQTVLHAALIGLVAGSALGFATGVLIDRSPFLQRGLLPLAALASTMPLVGIAPIMVMWFGFDWHSKAAVVVVMTFFPMLVNTLAGLTQSGAMERDLMRSYGASYWRTLTALRIPIALPFVFNALKVNSTLAMIGAIVAEFFGSPTAGLGFRISTEAARLDMGLVWAAIAVAALAGSLLYGLLGWVERRVTFWHPSFRTST